MADDITSSIATFFAENADGEFLLLPPAHPYSIIATTESSCRVLYTTKLTCLLKPLSERTCVPFSVIARAGLPGIHQLDWLRTVCDNSVVAFLGDCDPADLLIYLWLRSHIELKYIGVNDSLVADLKVAVSDNLTIPLAESEARAVSLLKRACPNLDSVIGSDCSALINSGRKLELEAVVHFARVDSDCMIKVLSERCR